MALIEDIFKGNLATGLAIGARAILFGPPLMQTIWGWLRPAAKAAIKGGMVFYSKGRTRTGLASRRRQARRFINRGARLALFAVSRCSFARERKCGAVIRAGYGALPSRVRARNDERSGASR